MAAPAEDLRCPTCGSSLAPVAPRGPTLQWVRCRHCGASVALAPTGSLPPRFTWEVYPGLYPSQPPLSRPRFRWRRIVVPILLAIALASLGAAAGAGFYLWQGSQPATYTVSGVAHLSNGPWLQGSVTVADESNTTVYHIRAGGAFSISGIPTGGVQLNFTYPGYAPVVVQTFVSPAYDAGSQGFSVTLSPGTVSNQSVTALSPYPDLEYFQAYLGAGAAMAVIVGLLAAGSAGVLRRSDRPAYGVVGAAGGVALPFALLILPVATVFPALLVFALLAGGLGALTLALAWVEIIQVSDQAPPTPRR